MRAVKQHDRKTWSLRKLQTYDRFKRKYLAQAKAAGQDPARPDELWLAKHIMEHRARHGRTYAVDYARNIGYYLEDVGAEPLTDAVMIRSVLTTSDMLDPLSFDYESGKHELGLRKARNFTSGMYGPVTALKYNNVSKRYSARCEANGVNFLAPPPGFIAAWFEELARDKRYTSISHMRSALSHLFRKHGVEDAAYAPDVDRTMEGIKRQMPLESVLPFSPQERRAILDALETEGLGVRDRVIALLQSFTVLGAEPLSLLTVEHCRFEADGVVITVGYEHDVFVGRHDDPVLDLATWLRRLIDDVGGSGPLFRKVDVRLIRLKPDPLGPGAINRALLAAAERAGVPTRNVGGRLRALFDLEKRAMSNAVLIAHEERRAIRGDKSMAQRAVNVAIRRNRGIV